MNKGIYTMDMQTPMLALRGGVCIAQFDIEYGLIYIISHINKLYKDVLGEGGGELGCIKRK